MSSQYFPPYRGHIADVKVRLDLAIYTTKTDLKNVTHVDTSSFALKTNFAYLKTEIDKLDIDKLKVVPTDLSKLSNVVKNEVIKKTEFNTLKTKVDNIDTKDFVKKTKYEADGVGLEKKISDIKKIIEKGTGAASKDDLEAVKNKIPNVSGFLLTSVFSSKITEVENKIPYIKNLVSKTELTVVENKIPNVNNLVTKTDYSAEITKIKNDCITSAALNARHKVLEQKTYFDAELKKVDDKVCKNSSDILSYKGRLKQKEHTVHDLERYASYLRGKNFFGHDGTQNYLVFQLMCEHLKRIIATVNNISAIYVYSYTSNGLSNEQIKAPNTSTNNDQAPILEYDGREISLKFSGDLLKQISVTNDHGPKVNIFIVYKLNSHTINTDFALKDCLFGSVKITKRQKS